MKLMTGKAGQEEWPMDNLKWKPIRILVADDEPLLLEAYRKILEKEGRSGKSGSPASEDMRKKLFGVEATNSWQTEHAFEVVYTEGAEAAVNAVRHAMEKERPFALAFIDMRMPPGPDGLWAAKQIRLLDSNIDLVIATAFSDVDPGEISAQIPPVDKVFYVQKPFHSFEISQLALSLGRKSQAEAKVRQLAYFDSLTGLPNREFFRDRLIQGIELSKRNGSQMAVLFMDLDNFKRINDTLGHSVGDHLLRQMALRLTKTLRSSDGITRIPAENPGENLARLGGDEFMVLLHEISRAEDAGNVASRILASLSQPLRLDEHEVIVTASIGIAVFPQDGKDEEILMKNADLAMYFTKRNGRNSFSYFSEFMNAPALKRLTMETLLRQAIECNELMLWYQPQMNFLNGEISGMEALLRWKSAVLGMIPPLEFIPVAEECGLILPIGEWVLRNACIQAKAWRDAGLPLPRVAVNVSTLQFIQTGFVDLVARVLSETGLEPEALELEVTENLLIKDAEDARSTLLKLKSLGVSLAIDDFGTGYSNISRLREFPIDRLKIDKSFIHAINTDNGEKAIATAVLVMADSLCLRVTAAGVETDGQIKYLKSRNCDEIQGFLFSRPLPAQDASAFLKRWVQTANDS
jgi:diguanylate cyclase